MKAFQRSSVKISAVYVLTLTWPHPSTSCAEWTTIIPRGPSPVSRLRSNLLQSANTKPHEDMCAYGCEAHSLSHLLILHRKCASGMIGSGVSQAVRTQFPRFWAGSLGNTQNGNFKFSRQYLEKLYFSMSNLILLPGFSGLYILLS